MQANTSGENWSLVICRYTELIRLRFPLLSTASLRVVGQEGHTPLLDMFKENETPGYGVRHT